MNTAPTYALSSRTPEWALDPYRFPGLSDLDTDEATDEDPGRPADRAAPARPHAPHGSAR
ncbi:hypothetical protein ABZZ17_04100 [Streptomyces sp. NPDC006512]|uniref:hypothetical protein n=1 Tax=Streptomyces sp. NPDC006512 TaxID=3154307 RepID=UPI0033B71E7A